MHKTIVKGSRTSSCWIDSEGRKNQMPQIYGAPMKVGLKTGADWQSKFPTWCDLGPNLSFQANLSITFVLDSAKSMIAAQMKFLCESRRNGRASSGLGVSDWPIGLLVRNRTPGPQGWQTREKDTNEKTREEDEQIERQALLCIKFINSSSRWRPSPAMMWNCAKDK